MYNKEDSTSRFFTTDDEKQTKIIWELHPLWWSRFCEYIWTAKFINQDDIILDSGAGICHPFKFYLTDLAKQVYACDGDARITDKNAILEDIRLSLGQKIFDEFDRKYLDKVNYAHCDIAETPYGNEFFDKITTVSVLEHLDTQKQKETLQEYHRILKSGGLVILTMDYPNVSPKAIYEYAKEIGFELLGEVDYNLPDNALSCDYWGSMLYCFRMVLVKK